MTGYPLDNSFEPPRWLRGRHFQTILPSLLWRAAGVRRRAAPLVSAAQELLLDCGDGVTLQAFHSGHPDNPRGLIAVLLHGWEGSSDSTYVMSMGQSLFAAGLDVVRLNLRDHGATHHLNRDLFHSCRLPEVVGAIQALARQFPGKRFLLGGFSLGGNFMLRVAAHAEAKHLPIERVLAVCPVLDPAVTMRTLEIGFPLYHRYFVRKWTRSLAKKQLAWPQHYDFADLLRVGNLREMTRLLVASHTEFPSVDEYLAGYAITGDRLKSLAAPADVFVALDDPIIESQDLSRLARAANLNITTTRHGGHCGFIERLGDPSWMDSRALRIVAEA